MAANDAEFLSSQIAARRDRVEEFRFIRETADRLGVKVWLFGGTAAGFAHYVKWDLQREAGDTRYQPDRFDYDYTNIYRSTQDLDLVVDGTSEQGKALEEALRARYPHAEGSKSVWEVRLLRQGTGDKVALLDNPDFLNQHTDSNSTGMIEISASKEAVVRDLRDWNAAKPIFLADVVAGRLHYYFSKKHETTSRYLEGKNPPILSAIRYLTKAFQYELKIPAADLRALQLVIEGFKPREESFDSYVRDWIERNAKKLFLNAVSVEYAWDTLEKLGLREKLVGLKDDADKTGSLAWWMSKEPLRSSEPGKGKGQTAAELGLDVLAHETSDFLAYEAITRSHAGEPNVFISRGDKPGEAAAFGDGFYMRQGRTGARGTGFTVRAHLLPAAREGKDFKVISADYVLVLNKSAIRLIPESLVMDPVEFFRILDGNSGFDISDKGVLEKLQRRIRAKLRALPPETVRELYAIVNGSIDRSLEEKKPLNELLLRQWFGIEGGLFRRQTEDKIIASGALWRNVRLAKVVLARRDYETLPEDARDLKLLVEPLTDGPMLEVALVETVLSKEEWMRHPGGLRMIEGFLGDKLVSEALAVKVLSHPYWATTPKGPELIRRYIEALAGDEFNQPYRLLPMRHILGLAHWAAHEEGAALVRLALEKLGAPSYVVLNVLSQPEWAARPGAIELLKLALAKENLYGNSSFFDGILKNPAWQSNPLIADVVVDTIMHAPSPLWLEGDILRSPVWSRHERALDFLEAYVQASLKGKYGWSDAFLQLPQWKENARVREALNGEAPNLWNLAELFRRGFTFAKCGTLMGRLGGKQR